MSVRGTHVPDHLRLPIAGVTPPPTEKEGQRLFPTGNFRFYRPVYRDKTPPCNNACPTGEQIQKYLDHVKHDRYLDGYLTILEDNPMPAVTGRVCYHPCETACNRAVHDEPIGIRGVERFLGDFGLKLADNPVKPALPPLNGTDGGDRGLGSRRPGLRLPPAPQGLRQRHLRGAGPAGRHAASRDPGLAPARGDPGRRDRQAARPGRHRDPLRGPGGRRPGRGDARLSPDHLRRGLPRPRPGRRPPARRRRRRRPGG